MTEGLPIGLVREVLKNSKGPILDPFLGAGTVLTEASLMRKPALGIDVNPFMCFVSRVKTRSYNVSEKLDLRSKRLTRLRRYYTPKTLQKLESLRLKIGSIPDKKVRNLFLLCFASVAVKTSKMEKTPALRFRTEPFHHRGVFAEFREKVSDVIIDLEQDDTRIHSDRISTLIKGNSRTLDFLDQKFKLIITSPPYCNNVDFVRHSQLELLWLGFATTKQDLGRIRHDAITSCEAMAHTNKDNEGVLPARLRRIIEKVHKRSERKYYEVIQQYFRGMNTHLDAAFSVLANSGKAVYVIGDSWFQNTYLPTHTFFARLARDAGFGHVRVRWLRRRFTGRPHGHKLSEYIIELRK